MAEDVTIGFIGYGNMAQAMARGLVDAGVVEGSRIVACAAHQDRLERNVKVIGARALRNAVEVAAASDVVVVAVKPNLVEQVLAPVTTELVSPSRFVVSVAAGWDLERYQALLGAEAHVQCTIPNTPIAVGEGVLIAETDNTLTDSQTALFERILSPVAMIERVDSAHMGIAMVIASCAPAFTDMYLEALGDAGVEFGLSRDAAYRLAAKMVEGVGALYVADERHPGAMKDDVCSPGGTTIRGVASLEKSAFRGAVISAVEAIEGR
ncbi:pyrroline-5-carboxylate reductase [uncultured Bifidobacterium sp.]|uniref:pyrroline-5-carboxylate reductase n=1 Tax=uncultured Bifidobacterium sp. TaxID=165187 RepID=UPI0028DC8332|nr:pyrroline-5-carboxylate reductase [uncultured Bifidobacterium sp.]